MISVAIVTASRSMRLAWQTAVEKMPHAQCVGVYATANALPSSGDGPPIDIVLLGLNTRERVVPLMQTVQSAEPQARILVLAAQLTDKQLFSALRVGAAGFLSHNIFSQALQKAIDQLSRGETPLSKEVAQRIMDSFKAQRSSDNLSEREQEVYRLLCAGKNYREIAAELFVSQNTVRFHLKNIYKKLGVKSRHEAMARAYEADGY
ncbi:MAG: response regulator transcription factor [Bacteroidota bacterium]